MSFRLNLAPIEAILKSLETKPTVVEQNGRFFITMGNPGFNSPANNGRGYATKGRALAAVRFYSQRGA